MTIKTGHYIISITYIAVKQLKACIITLFIDAGM